jgi:hypothetical protein
MHFRRVQPPGYRNAFWLVRASERQSPRLIDRFAHQSDDFAAAAFVFRRVR